jgi:hypothetical protein
LIPSTREPARPERRRHSPANDKSKIPAAGCGNGSGGAELIERADHVRRSAWSFRKWFVKLSESGHRRISRVNAAVRQFAQIRSRALFGHLQGFRSEIGAAHHFRFSCHRVLRVRVCPAERVGNDSHSRALYIHQPKPDDSDSGQAVKLPNCLLPKWHA